MAERARLERDGDLGVLVIDNQPLNLFDGEMVRDILAALEDTGDCRALLVRAEGSSRSPTGWRSCRSRRSPRCRASA